MRKVIDQNRQAESKKSLDADFDLDRIQKEIYNKEYNALVNSSHNVNNNNNREIASIRNGSSSNVSGVHTPFFRFEKSNIVMKNYFVLNIFKEISNSFFIPHKDKQRQIR